jgi:UDP-glucose 4-epimerase
MYLITGASGFIGSRLVNALKSMSLPIILLGREKIPGFKTILLNLEDELITDGLFDDVETIIHLAGYAHSAKKSPSKNYLYKSINTDAALRLASLASIAGVKKFIFISSVKASGAKLSKECVKENDQVDPIDLYGKSKRETEIKLLEISNKSGMEVLIIRPSLVYGPEVKGNLSIMMSNIDRGWFPPIPKINNRRSMVHVDDLVRAIIFLMNNDRANGEIFNVTDGNYYSTREIYEAMCNVLTKRIPRWSVPLILFKVVSIISFGKLFDFNKLFADECYSSEKLCSLGFKPQRSIGEMNETIF